MRLESGPAEPVTDIALLCAIVAANIARDEIVIGDWAHIVTLAVENHLAPMLYFQFFQLGLLERLDTRSRTILDNQSRATAVRNALFEREQQRISAALAADSIDVLWLKGLTLAQALYPQLACRPMVDLDLLIPEERRAAAAHVMEQLGYQFDPDDQRQLFAGNRALANKIGHHDVYRQIGNIGSRVEIHYRIGTLRGIPQAMNATEWIWQQTVIDEDGTRRLSSEALLLYLCAHIALQHGDQNVSLKHYLDIHLLVTNTPIEWNFMIEQAVKLHWTTAVEHVLDKTARLFLTVIPDNAIQRLRASRSASENWQHFRSFQEEGAVIVSLKETLKLLSFRERIWLLMRIIVPPTAYMRHHYSISENRAVLPYYLLRWTQQIRQLGTFLGRRLHRSPN